jgi:hypothetical protein
MCWWSYFLCYFAVEKQFANASLVFFVHPPIPAQLSDIRALHRVLKVTLAHPTTTTRKLHFWNQLCRDKLASHKQIYFRRAHFPRLLGPAF